MCDSGVKTGEFVKSLLAYFQYLNIITEEDIWITGRKRGWLEEQDRLWEERPIEKRQASRIVHEFLRIEGHEKDERDIRKAQKLEDLYHCRVCANHVAQVFVKEIIPARNATRFGILDPVSKCEMTDIFGRMSKIVNRNLNLKE